MKRGRSDRGDGASVGVAEAAVLLGIAEDVLVEALVEHGMSEAEARNSRLLKDELDNYRHLQRDAGDANAALSALREALDDD